MCACVVGSATYFGAYEAISRALRPESGQLSIGVELFAGGMAGVAMVCWPLSLSRQT